MKFPYHSAVEDRDEGPWFADWGAPASRDRRPPPVGDFPPSGHACAYCPGVSKSSCCQHKPQVVYVGSFSGRSSDRLRASSRRVLARRLLALITRKERP